MRLFEPERVYTPTHVARTVDDRTTLCGLPLRPRGGTPPTWCLLRWIEMHRKHALPCPDCELVFAPMWVAA